MQIAKERDPRANPFEQIWKFKLFRVRPCKCFTAQLDGGYEEKEMESSIPLNISIYPHAYNASYAILHSPFLRVLLA